MIFRSFYCCNAHYIIVLSERGQGDHAITRREKMTKQKTFTVDGQKIVIKSRPRTHVKNFIGYWVNINGKKIYRARLIRQEAEDWAYAKWVAAQ